MGTGDRQFSHRRQQETHESTGLGSGHAGSSSRNDIWQRAAREREQQNQQTQRNRGDDFTITTFTHMVNEAARPGSTFDSADAITSWDLQHNPDLMKHLTMLRRFDMSHIPRINDNTIRQVQNTCPDGNVKTQMLRAFQSINKLKDYKEYAQHTTRVGACKDIKELQDTLNDLYNISGEQTPSPLKFIRSDLNRYESEFDGPSR